MVKKLIKKILGKGKKEAAKAPTEKKNAPSSARSSKPNKAKSGTSASKPRPGKKSEGSVPKKDREPQKRWSLKDFKVPVEEGKSRFHDFELPTPIMHAIHDLGFQYCTPIQTKVMAHVREGQNIAGKAQTGTGKTAAFLICILAQYLASRRDGDKPRKPGTPRALILAPTRELVLQIAKDAEELSKYAKFRCMAVYGGMDFEKQKKQLLQHPIDLVAATPGRLLDFNKRGVLDLKQVDVLVIDEADRMLDMGFVPDVSRIVRATPPKDRRQTMLFSATLTDTVLKLAAQWMPDPVFCEVDPEQVTVDTVKQLVYSVTVREKFNLLCNLLKREKMNRVLIFGNRREATRRLAEKLNRNGYRCELLSGAVRQEKRIKILENFRAGRIKIVVATDVAGRGLHVDDIDFVINYEFPYEAEDYVHRIGRTGRAGTEGTAISFACENESFVIPDIEEYIGQPLPCVMPEEEMVAPCEPGPDKPTYPSPKKPDAGRPNRGRRPPPRRR